MARLCGLTGGIASGKSTVGGFLRERGAAVVDADLLAREIVEPGAPALVELVARFGEGVLLPDGRLNRPALGAIVFHDAQARADLNAITHPRIALLAAERTRAFAAAGAPIVFYEAALLVENGLHHGLDALVVVWVPREVQLQRLLLRDGLSEADAQARLRSQLPLDEKRLLATHVIDNSGDREATRAQTLAVYDALLRG